MRPRVFIDVVRKEGVLESPIKYFFFISKLYYLQQYKFILLWLGFLPVLHLLSYVFCIFFLKIAPYKLILGDSGFKKYGIPQEMAKFTVKQRIIAQALPVLALLLVAYYPDAPEVLHYYFV